MFFSSKFIGRRKAISILLTGSMLATSSVALAAITEGYAEHDAEAKALLDSVPWDEPIVVEIAFDDHSYTPDEITLPLNKPAILRLKNVGTVVHDMIGGSLFSSVLIKHVSTPSGRVVTPYVRSVFLRARQTTDIYLLPIKAGVSTFECTIAGHKEAGMTGQITIK